MSLLPIKNFDPKQDHFIGNADAKVVMIEYGDYTCPECRQIRDVLLRLSDRLVENLTFVYRHFIDGDEGIARLAAQAAEAAGMQNKFWEMHRRLFDRDSRLDEQSLIEYANEIGLDVEKFKRDLHSDAAKKRVEEDYENAANSGG